MNDLAGIKRIVVMRSGHTFVVFDSGYVICSCRKESGIGSPPNLRRRCVICGRAMTMFVHELEEFLCVTHDNDYWHWGLNNPDALPTDYLREKIHDYSS